MKALFRKHFVKLLILSVLLFTSGFFCLTWYSRPYLTVIGPVLMEDGIGRQSVELIEALYDEVDIGFIPTHNPCLQDVPARIVPLINSPNKKLGRVVIFEEPLPNPNHKMAKRLNKHLRGPKTQDQIRIAYTMLESSRIPPLWAEMLNCYFDLVAVPDEFLIEVYEQSGVKIPIFVLPLGFDMDHFLHHPLKTSQNSPFCFINTSSLIPRKNHEGLIQAFYKAFGNDPEVLLRMNYRYKVGDAFSSISQLIQSLKVDNILLTNEKLDKQGYLQFLSKGDVFVSLTKGEGFSIQPREAMAMGLPVVISDNTAHKTILKTGLAFGVSCPTSAIAHNAFLHCTCGVEYIADVEEAAKVLRDLYENYDHALNQASTRREWAKNYRFENLKGVYLNLVKPKKLILGDHNEITEEALITTSVDLYNKYKRLSTSRYL